MKNLKTKSGSPLHAIINKYPSFQHDFKLKWRSVMNTILDNQVKCNRYSSRVGHYINFIPIAFPYLDSEDEVRTVATAIKDRFNLRKYDFEKYHHLLPNVFDTPSDVTTQLESLCFFNDNGTETKSTIEIKTPETNKQLKDKTYTFNVTDSEGNIVLCLDKVPADITFTTISQLTSSIV